MHRLLPIIAAGIAAVVGALPVQASDAGAQARAEEAVAVFNERFTDAGWRSNGPQPVVDPEEGESEFGDCFGGMELMLDNTDERIEGETARAYSDEFLLGDPDPPTGSDAAAAESAFAAAAVITVDDDGMALLEDFVTILGAEDAATCIEDVLHEQYEADEGEVTIDATVDDDLGIGDQGGRFDLALTSEAMDTMVSYNLSMAAVRADHSLVAVIAGGTGDSIAELDVVAELEAMVDALG